MAAKFEVFRQHVYDGMVLNANIPDRSLDMLKNGQFVYRPTDILVAGFPKSGNHWLINMVRLMLGAEDIDAVLQTNLWTQFLMLESHFQPDGPTSDYTDEPAVDVATHMRDPRVFLSHLPANFFRDALDRKLARFIIPVRNVKDVLVSWYNHQKLDPGYGLGKDFDFSDFFGMFERKQLAFGDWFDNVTSWEPYFQQDNVLLVYYEENIAHHSRITREVARFLNITLDDVTIERIAQETLFKNTKENKDRSIANWIDNTKGSFMRKGRVGSWKEEMTEVQSARLDELVRDKLKHSKLMFQYE